MSYETRGVRLFLWSEKRPVNVCSVYENNGQNLLPEVARSLFGVCAIRKPFGEAMQVPGRNLRLTPQWAAGIELVLSRPRSAAIGKPHRILQA